jgi:DNA-binding transcriptional regulator YiaG
MTPRQLREFRQRLGLTQAEFADCISVAPNTVARWERGELGMRASTEKLLEILMQQTDLTTPTIPEKPIKPDTTPSSKRRK